MTILATSSEKVVEIKYFAHNKSSRKKGHQKDKKEGKLKKKKLKRERQT